MQAHRAALARGAGRAGADDGSCHGDRDRARASRVRLPGRRPDRRGVPPAARPGAQPGLARFVSAVVRRAGPGGGRLREQIDANILNLTGGRHRRLRALVGPAFSPRAADAWRPVMRGYLERMWAGLGPATSAEFVEALAKPYPSLTITAVLGAPEADAPRLHEWSHWVQR